ncbi:hypothetical protein ABZ078_30420 [Streptomyces sp. NPDC006385]|uniref:hypothetical protein n=1 Tax=unclassified Streptomyces TaxID=2593676 RepID=UPI0033B2C26D
MAARFTDSLTSDPGLELALLRPLLTLLTVGEPVTADQLAAEIGRAREEFRQALTAMPDTAHTDGFRVQHQ